MDIRFKNIIIDTDKGLRYMTISSWIHMLICGYSTFTIVSANSILMTNYVSWFVLNVINLMITFGISNKVEQDRMYRTKK